MNKKPAMIPHGLSAVTEEKMGHTLVASFPEQLIHNLTEAIGTGPNKIPFGRDCDRNEANLILPYHVTLCHWGKNRDGELLEKVKQLKFEPFELIFTGVSEMMAEEESRLLYFCIKEGAGYCELARSISETVGIPCTPFLHSTIAVSKNSSEIQMYKDAICHHFQFPFSVSISALDLYQIWQPTKLIRTLTSCSCREKTCL